MDEKSLKKFYTIYRALGAAPPTKLSTDAVASLRILLIDAVGEERQKELIGEWNETRTARLVGENRNGGPPITEGHPSSMASYFRDDFQVQLRTIEVSQPNRVVLERIIKDPNAHFFGGRNWENVQNDLESVPVGSRAHFILALFMIVVTDQAIYTYFHRHYPKWREQTGFPKFGWSGFGPHHENPMKILWAPERERLMSLAENPDLISEFVTFWVEETSRYFAEQLPEVKVRDFFNSILSDQCWLSFNEGETVPKLKKQTAQAVNELP